MSALDRVKRDDNNNMMVPQNVAGGTYQEGASVVQAVAACILLVGIIVIILWFKDTRMATKITSWIVLIAFIIFVSQLVIRYLIINEVYLMNQTDKLQRAHNKVPADLWNVINIDDDGIIYYQDGRLGLLIEAEQATVVGRDEQFRDVHYSCISNFYKILNQNFISWTHYNSMISAKMENRLNIVNEELDNCKNKNIKRMCEMHLVHLRNKEIRTLYEKEHWMLIARPSLGKEKLIDIAYQAIENLEGAAFNRASILKKEYCYAFNVELQALNSFDANAIMIEKAQRVAGTMLAKLTSVKIDTGFMSEKSRDIITNVLKAHNDGSSYVETVEHITTLQIGDKLRNVMTQRLQYFIREKRQLNEGELMSNILNIKLVNSINFAQNSKSENKQVETDEQQEVYMFDFGGSNTKTAEETEEDITKKLEQSKEANMRLMSAEEEERARKRAAKRLTLSEKKLKAQETLKEQQAEKAKQQEELERQKKAKVNFDDFNEDD